MSRLTKLLIAIAFAAVAWKVLSRDAGVDVEYDSQHQLDDFESAE